MRSQFFIHKSVGTGISKKPPVVRCGVKKRYYLGIFLTPHPPFGNPLVEIFQGLFYILGHKEHFWFSPKKS